MIKKTRFILCLTMAFLLSSAGSVPAAPADTPQQEIIYRTSLGRADDVKLLLTQGVSPDEKNEAGVPLLALAAIRKDKECINVMDVLLEAGAPIEEQDSDGQTPLFYAVKQDNLKAVNYLLSKGANYYATDNNGNTARNAAYLSGHEDIGKVIDDFIKKQSDDRAKQYDEFNRIVAEHSKPVVIPAPPAQTEAAPEQPQPPDNPPVTTPTPEEQAAQEAAQKKREADIKHLNADVAFNNCAFQYWSFVSDTGQSTELSPDTLEDTIDSYQDKIQASQDTLSSYQVSEDVITKISNSAKQRIFSELSVMPSKNDRHEQGVGKKDDMQSRCKLIARHWDKEPPPTPTPPPSKKKESNNNVIQYNSNQKQGKASANFH